MTQAERDRLVALKKAEKKLITQKQVAEELGITERHVRRLLRELKRRGVQALRPLSRPKQTGHFYLALTRALQTRRDAPRSMTRRQVRRKIPCKRTLARATK